MKQIKKDWQGEDVLMRWHEEKAKSSVSEAFKDATYASPITQFKSDALALAEFLFIAALVGSAVLGMLFVVGVAVVKLFK